MITFSATFHYWVNNSFKVINKAFKRNMPRYWMHLIQSLNTVSTPNRLFHSVMKLRCGSEVSVQFWCWGDLMPTAARDAVAAWCFCLVKQAGSNELKQLSILHNSLPSSAVMTCCEHVPHRLSVIHSRSFWSYLSNTISVHNICFQQKRSIGPENSTYLCFWISGHRKYFQIDV